jgi:hypothetical protein
MSIPPDRVYRGHTTLEAAALLGNLDRRTLVRELHVDFKMPYVYDYINKLCRTQAEVIVTMYVYTNVNGI